MGTPCFLHLNPASELLDPADLTLIRNEAPKADRKARLSDPVLDLARRRRWWHVLNPHCFGGLDLEFPQALRLEEALAQADGSLGWTATLASGASWFCGSFHPVILERLYRDPHLFLTGSGHCGRADCSKDGYVLEGSWPHASGWVHATHLTLNATVYRHGHPVLHPDGSALYHSFVIDASRAERIENWPSMGLRATGSHGFRLKSCEVGPEAVFDIGQLKSGTSDPVFRIPFGSLAEATLAANLSGLALGYVEAFGFGFGDLNHPTALHLPASVRMELLAFYRERERFYRLQDAAWIQWTSGSSLAASHLAELAQSARELARTAQGAVLGLHPFAGLRGSSLEDPLNRWFRDVFTASQHPVLRRG